MLRDARLRHPERRSFVLPVKVAEESPPRSTSSPSSSRRRGIGIAAEGDSLAVSPARAWTSSDLFSPSRRRSLELPCAIDLTTSPLQMGQVLRLLTSQGVLQVVSDGQQHTCTGSYMQPAWNSCPHGRRMTRLWPSINSSKQTTHSIWRPV